jgi:hypothetical protein
MAVEKNKSQPGSETPEEAGARARAEAAKTEMEAKAKAKAEAVKTESVLIRHKTPYEKYRCAGLVLTKRPESYRVTEAQAEKLRRDPWVAVEKENGPK